MMECRENKQYPDTFSRVLFLNIDLELIKQSCKIPFKFVSGNQSNTFGLYYENICSISTLICLYLRQQNLG